MIRGFARYVTLFCTIVVLLSAGGVWAIWQYACIPPEDVETDIPIQIKEFHYEPPMPEKEVTLMERIYALLNNQYTNDLIEAINLQNGYHSPRECLLSTLDKDWTEGESTHAGSFVGSMDPTADSQRRLSAMFSDIIDISDPNSVSFILKSENLVGDWVNEVALYSTSDDLHEYYGEWHTAVVGVYMSVFTPVYDDQWTIIGYELLCDSIHGYCTETEYTKGSNIPSFSTDHWRDELFYWRYLDGSYTESELKPITGEDRYKYECYHPADGFYPYEGRLATWMGWIEVPTDPGVSSPKYGKTAEQRLEEIVASQS
jgi:hypothetical protein